MFISLMPEEISRNWELIKKCTEDSLPPIHAESPNMLNNILMALLDGRMTCWASYQYDKDKNVVLDAIGITRIEVDPYTNVSQCLIYTAYAFEWATEKSWLEAFETFVKYLKSKNCTRIMAYTKIPTLVERWKEFGGEADTTILTMNVDHLW